MGMLTYLYVHPIRGASKPTRNGYVHPMDILLTTLLTCEYARDIISGVTDLNAGQAKSEIVETIKSTTEPGCDWTQMPTEGTGN